VIRLVDKLSINPSGRLITEKWTGKQEKFSTQLTGIIVIVRFNFLKILKTKKI